MAASWPIQFTKGSRSRVKRCQQSTEEDTIQFCIKNKIWQVIQYYKKKMVGQTQRPWVRQNPRSCLTQWNNLDQNEILLKVVLNTINGQIFLFWDFIFKFGSYIVFCVVLLCVSTFCVPCCGVCWDFRMEAMFSSSLSTVVCRRVLLLIELFVFLCLQFFVGGSFSWLGCLCFFVYSCL